ncbi:IncP-type conjugal transfer protein TrbI [Aminobacter anthyllidis]|uniref:IncP-type conjugal transfer protein TrbI n=1 Tax=Aminobacter anthyllidis TaxID=1035067 RepID=A0A9X1AID6_9HYPH|nr:IncP-type conjugal transfer protein TrbI [Aminobacter anthyllidis]MBT1160154.1 IncP-type conjugal transfer protein TrbI [Aminobacter anthyllidis]
MVQSLKLGGAPNEESGFGIRRLNRLPVIVAGLLVILFFAVIIFGLTSRGLFFRGDDAIDAASNISASTFADHLKRGVSDGIIGEPAEAATLQPSPIAPAEPQKATDNPFEARPRSDGQSVEQSEPEEVWKARLEREQREQYIRERHRQKMARLQANDAAYDSPLTISLNKLEAAETGELTDIGNAPAASATSASAANLYAAALQAGIGGQSLDPNGQRAKEDFYNADMRELGYLPNKLLPQQSPYELKRGSVIPAILITGITSDLPGRITAQVSQNVYDSATGHRLLIPRGTKLFGRYDAEVSFGQSRVLVVWTDIIFPNGSTLQIGGMAGTDAEGNGGFKDKVDNHYFKTFGSAILLAIIGTGIDMAVPNSSTRANHDTASDAARRNFAETFGRVAERTISKNLDVQPTLEIRPGYKFNVLVDQDIVFPSAYRG